MEAGGRRESGLSENARRATWFPILLPACVSVIGVGDRWLEGSRFGTPSNQWCRWSLEKWVYS